MSKAKKTFNTKPRERTDYRTKTVQFGFVDAAQKQEPVALPPETPKQRKQREHDAVMQDIDDLRELVKNTTPKVKPPKTREYFWDESIAEALAKRYPGLDFKGDKPGAIVKNIRSDLEHLARTSGQPLPSRGPILRKAGLWSSDDA